MKIGVFDSGLGGLSVAKAVRIRFPDHEVIFRDDKAHVPYGTRNSDELLEYVVPIFQEMIDDGCALIVVACNTVSTTLIKDLRCRFEVPLIAIEPMVKPAAAITKTGVITVCATPTTLKSDRYHQLKEMYAQNVTVLEPNCADWASMIENNQMNELKLGQQIKELLRQKADVIVLACTHYHWIEQEILDSVAGKAKVLQPEAAIVTQVAKVLLQQQ